MGDPLPDTVDVAAPGVYRCNRCGLRCGMYGHHNDRGRLVCSLFGGDVHYGADRATGMLMSELLGDN